MKKDKCTKCERTKPIGEFYKNKSKKTGRNSQCKTCESAYKKVWGKTDHAKGLKLKSYHKKENRDKTLAKYAENMKDPEFRKKKNEVTAKWASNNPEKKAASNKASYEKNKPKRALKSKERYEKNKTKILADQKEKRKDPEFKKKKLILDNKWKAKNVEHLRKYFRDRARLLSKTDPIYKLRCQIRKSARRVNEGMLGKHRTRVSSLNQLGCTIEEYRSHIESQWEDWMNWKNYGPDLDTQWQIDHKTPIDWFIKNSSNPHEANHYSNLGPLRGRDNIEKSNKIYNENN